MSVDPHNEWTDQIEDPQRWNRYAYVRNSPLRHIDPDGKKTIDLAIGFGQGIGQVALVIAKAPYAIATNPGGVFTGLMQDASLLAYGVTHPSDVANTYVALATSPNGADQRALGAAFGQGTAVAALVLAPTAKAVPEAAPVADVSASTPVGRLGSPLEVAPGTNAPTTIGGRPYTGHALDQMQGRGLTPSVVEDTISRGAQTPGRGGATVHTTEQARIILNPSGSVKTVYPQ